AAGQIDEAAVAFREALRIDDHFGPAHVGLGRALLARGDFREAIEAVAHGDPGMFHHDRGLDPGNVARTAERMIALESRLESVRSGKCRPGDAQECAEFAQLCFFKRHFAYSARFWSEAFAAQPALADRPGSENRHQAARAAALASCETGEDEPP